MRPLAPHTVADRLADLATITAETCICGRTSPLLSELEERVSEIVHLPGGVIAAPGAVWETLRKTPGAPVETEYRGLESAGEFAKFGHVLALPPEELPPEPLPSARLPPERQPS
jgi:hypothetical protein